MSKKHKTRDVCRAQYEIPGSAAAVLLAQIDHEERVMAVQVQRYGDTPMLAKGREIRQAMRQTAREWQLLAKLVTNYDCARKAVTEEKRG